MNTATKQPGPRVYHAVRQTGCRHCDLDIEGFAPYRRGEWRDRGNNTLCHSGPNKGKAHAPYWPL